MTRFSFKISRAYRQKKNVWKSASECLCTVSSKSMLRGMMSTPGHASRALLANKQILCDKKVRLAVRLRFFDRVTTPVALFCFWPSNNPDGRLVQIGRCFSQNAAYDCRAAKFRGMHHWNGKAVAFAQQHGLDTWSEQCFKQHWKLAMHVANLPPNRWVKRVLLWNPIGARRRGYPRHDRASKLVAYTRFNNWVSGCKWQMLAQDRPWWMQSKVDFVKFWSTR